MLKSKPWVRLKRNDPKVGDELTGGDEDTILMSNSVDSKARADGGGEQRLDLGGRRRRRSPDLECGDMSCISMLTADIALMSDSSLEVLARRRSRLFLESRRLSVSLSISPGPLTTAPPTARTIAVENFAQSSIDFRQPGFSRAFFGICFWAASEGALNVTRRSE